MFRKGWGKRGVKRGRRTAFDEGGFGGRAVAKHIFGPVETSAGKPRCDRIHGEGEIDNLVGEEKC